MKFEHDVASQGVVDSKWVANPSDDLAGVFIGASKYIDFIYVHITDQDIVLKKVQFYIHFYN